jgi:hypothetical protein
MNSRVILIGAGLCAFVAVFIFQQSGPSRSAPTQELPSVPGQPAGAPSVVSPQTEQRPTDLGSGRTLAQGEAPGADKSQAVAAAQQAALVAKHASEVRERPQQTAPGSIPATAEGDGIGPDAYDLESKYAGFDAAQILSAFEAVEAELSRQSEASGIDKSDALPPEARAALELERQWLKQRAYP